MAKPPLELAKEIMLEFAENTKILENSLQPRRYLWTDAFATCNFMELYKQTGDQKFRDITSSLINQVHEHLGQHRADDVRNGWISGLGAEEGKLHPTIGGLRIGKKLPERSTSDAFDDRLEWDRDGQYYHYVTKWMQALICMGKFNGDSQYALWAAEMAKTVHAKFTYDSGNKKRMYWKMSIDLSHPQVLSMGHHDPLDGYITYQQIQAGLVDVPDTPDLNPEIIEMAEMCSGREWVTSDPLGLGGLMCDAFRVLSLMATDKCHDENILMIILESATKGLDSFMKHGCQGHPENRLAFREFGLAIGLRAIKHMQTILLKCPALVHKHPKLPKLLSRLEKHSQLADEIISFWSRRSNQKSHTWNDHLDINMVMLATSLIPSSFLIE